MEVRRSFDDHSNVTSKQKMIIMSIHIGHQVVVVVGGKVDS